MMEPTKPDVIITHESDLDGFLSGVLLQRLAKKLYDIDVPLEAYHYNQWKQRELRERAAWVADFTFEPRLDKSEWMIVDHHVTESAPKNALLIHDVNKSAALLCYELCQGSRPRLARARPARAPEQCRRFVSGGRPRLCAGL